MGGAVLLGLLALPGGASAQSAVGRACFEQATTTSEMTNCARTELQRQQIRLGLAQVKLRRQLAAGKVAGGAPSEAQLAKAVAAWRTWRDAECALRADTVRGGSLAGLMRLRCLADLTRRQVQALREASE